MISYTKALRLIGKISINLKKEKISTINSINRVSAENVLSPNNNPLSNNAAFDGFAILSRETKNLSKIKVKKFKILKTIAAGDNPKIKNYKKNSVAEVMTGGLIPKHYDSILPIEKAKYYPSNNNPTHLIVSERVKKFSYVRFAGEDYKKKDIVLKKGELIQPKHLMAFTVLGIKEIKVKKKPKIIFFSTGNEIVDYKKKNIPAWKVRNSNNYYFKAFADSMNLEIINGGTIKDNKSNKLKKLLRKFLKSDIDLFVTSGAISAGKYDFIPKLVKNFGFKKCFKGVAIKPGRPIMLSKLKNKLFFGLPGNPISCAAGFRFFIYPLIRNSLGMLKEKNFRAQLVNKYSKSKNFTHFARCLINFNNKGSGKLQALQGQQSHRIESFVKANCWGIFPGGKERFKSGNIIEWVNLIPKS